MSESLTDEFAVEAGEPLPDAMPATMEPGWSEPPSLRSAVSRFFAWRWAPIPLGFAMAGAAVGGFAFATALLDRAGQPPPAPRKVEVAAAKPEPTLKIEVRKDAPPQKPVVVAVVPERVWSESAAAASAPPVRAASGRIAPTPNPPPPLPPHERSQQLADAQTSPPVPRALQAPPRSAVQAPAPSQVQVPIAAPPAQAQPQQTPQQPDLELALADKELVQAYRAAQAAGVPAAEIRADQAAWRTVRDRAAQRSRGALLYAYQDHIDELRGLAEDAQGQRQERADRDYYDQQPGYDARSYGQGYPYGQGYRQGGYGQAYPRYGPY